ncbi:MAG: protein kinase [Phycisphaerales bacterium]|nr:MAG: protein kinase [Phycisphaerales bacterium]
MAFTFKHGDRPLEDYTVHRGVGRGGFGEVYYAISDGGREVALKYLRENPEVELRGVSHCINLKSPHLVTIFDVRKNADDDFFIVMEYVSGPSLRDLLVAEPGGLGVQKAAFFLRELAKGLSYLHDRGIVHRDLKPGNIFYDDGYVKIGDYGLSKFISASRHSVQTASVGTVHYMAPEVGSGNYSRGIDIYALGVILYEMLLGKVPFEGGSAGEVLMKHLTAQPEVDHLPAPFGAVIRKALAKDPNARYQTIDEMMNDVFDVDDVRNSLVGFNPTSLSQAAARVARDLPDSPVPSPYPPPPPPVPAFALAADAGVAGAGVGRLGPVGPPPYPAAGFARPDELTPEAAAGNLRYAGFWIRVVSAFIDIVIVGLIGALFGEQATGGLIILYQGLLVGLWNGQTLGKRACDIKVICSDGRPCGVGRAFGRAFAKFLNVLTMFIGYMIIWFDDRKQGLHDHVAGTMVVYTVPRA